LIRTKKASISKRIDAGENGLIHYASYVSKEDLLMMACSGQLPISLLDKGRTALPEPTYGKPEG